MDVIENKTISLRKVSKHWNIPFTSLSNHLYGKTKSRKPRPTCMLEVNEDQVVVAWVLSM
jgi:transposase-like protein